MQAIRGLLQQRRKGARKAMRTLPTWRQLNMDTSPEMERLHFALLREAPSWRKVKMLTGMERSARSLALVGLRRRHPGASQEELHFKVTEWLYGKHPNKPNGDGFMTDYQTVDVALIVTEILERLGIPYMLGGSLASAMYGMVRYTNDADLVADIKPHQVKAFAEALSPQFYVYADSILGAIQHQSSFNLIHHGSSIKIDIFVKTRRAFDKEQLSRRTREVISAESGRSAWVCTPEDIILAKLEWFRLGGEMSERQWRDVLGVLKIQAEALDEDYLRHWATILRIDDLLERALEEGKKTE